MTYSIQPLVFNTILLLFVGLSMVGLYYFISMSRIKKKK